MYFMDLWLLFPKFQGQALNFHLVKTAEILIISLPCMDLIYIITFGILNHTYIIFERFKQKHQFVVPTSNFVFFLKKKKKKDSWYTIEWLTADELFIWSFNKPQVVGNQKWFHTWMFNYRCKVQMLQAHRSKEHVIARVPNKEDYGESLMLLYRLLLAILIEVLFYDNSAVLLWFFLETNLLVFALIFIDCSKFLYLFKIRDRSNSC